MTLSISDRRALIEAAGKDPDFRNLLRKDPRRALEQATGRELPEGALVTLFEEQADAWEFVLPNGAIDANLPDAHDVRALIENQVYALLRDEPAVRARIGTEPRAVLAERLHFIMTGPLNVREERPGELFLVLPYANAREELSDEALDLVAGGSSVGCTAPGDGATVRKDS